MSSNRSAALFALIGSLAIGFLAGTTVDESTSVPAWPPQDPSLIVNLNGETTFVRNRPDRKEIYVVPEGYWFVLTDFESFTAAPEIPRRSITESPNRGVSLLLRHPNAKEDVLVLPWYFSAEHHSRAGVTFPPNAKILLEVEPPKDDPEIQRVVEARWVLDGYLVEARGG